MIAAIGARNLSQVDAGVVDALMQARYQNSSRGQFLSGDPVLWSSQQTLSDPQSLNSYSYANDNLINKSDPTGLKSSFTDMGFFNSNYLGQPASVVRQIHQAKYDALKIAVGLPIATEMAGGILASAVMAPELAVGRAAAAELSLKVGDGGNRKGGISWGCLTPPLLHRRSDMPCPKITSSS